MFRSATPILLALLSIAVFASLACQSVRVVDQCSTAATNCELGGQGNGGAGAGGEGGLGGASR